MKIHDIRLRQKAKQKAWRSQFVHIPCIGMEGEQISVIEDRLCRRALITYFENQGMGRPAVIGASDDLLAPEIPMGAWLGVDKSARRFQGNAFYVTKPFGEAAASDDGLWIARIQKTDSGYDYIYDKASPIHLDDLSGIEFIGRVEAISVREGFNPKARRI